MIFETANSIYQVREREKRFRRIHESGPPTQRIPLGRWFRFQRMSPVTVGEPVRFFWLLGEDGGLSHIGLWATGVVITILPDEDPSFSACPPGAATGVADSGKSYTHANAH